MPLLLDLWEGDHLSPDALAQFGAGTLSPDALLEADAHLSSCEKCQTRLAQNREQNNQTTPALVALTEAFAREEVDSPVPRIAPSVNGFPDFDSIAGFVDGTLFPAELAAFQVALQRFPTLAGEVADLRALREELRATRANEVSAPPMIVKRPTDAAPPRKWWEPLVWPLQTFGATAFAAMLLLIFGISPLKQQLAQQRAQQTQLSNELATERTRREQAASGQQAAQKSVLQKQRSLEISQKQRDELQTANARQIAEMARQNAEIARQKDHIARLSQTASAQAPTPVSAPTFAPVKNSDTNSQNEQLLQSVFAQRELAPDLAGLRTKATASKGNAKPFRLRSPIATKVRELHPILRWDKVPGATSYRVMLRDETEDVEDGLIYQSQPASASPWKVPAQLKRGHRYKWEITALVNEKPIAKAPQSPDLEALFEVLSEPEFQVLQQNLRKAGRSPLAEALVLVSAGLEDEAREKMEFLSGKH